jgi:hypothetical protein
MGVRGCAQILSQSRKSAKSQAKIGKKLKKVLGHKTLP